MKISASHLFLIASLTVGLLSGAPTNAFMDKRSCTVGDVEATFNPNIGAVESMVSDGTYIWVGTGSNKIKQLTMAGSTVRTLTGHTGDINALTILGSHVYSASDDGTIKKWKKTSSTVQGTYTVHGGQPVKGLVNDGSHLFTASNDDTSKKVSSSGSVLETYTSGTSNRYDVVVRSSYVYLTGQDQRIRKFNKNGNYVSLKHIGDIGDSLATDGSNTFVGQKLGKIKMYSPALNYIREFTGHTDRVIDVFYADGTLYSGSLDGSVKMWNPSTGALISTLYSGSVGIEAVVKEGDYLYVGFNDGKVRKLILDCGSSPPPPPPPPPPPSGCSSPADILDLSYWKITIPCKDGDPNCNNGVNPGNLNNAEELYSSDLLGGYEEPAVFTGDCNNNRVEFQVRAGGATTSGSGYPRSEFREMTTGGALANWKSDVGRHELFAEVRVVQLDDVTHGTNTRTGVVLGQIHDDKTTSGYDDVIMILAIRESPSSNTKIRTSWIGSKTSINMNNNYSIGSWFTYKIVTENDVTKWYYNGGFVDQRTLYFYDAYFKAGAYFQVACTTGNDKKNTNDCGDRTRVQFKQLTVSHT